MLTNGKWIALTRAAVVFALLAVGMTVLASVYVSVQNNQVVTAIETQQDSNTELLDETRRAAEEAEHGTDIIIDCTREGGRCFAKGQERTGEAVGQILLAAVCTDQPGAQTAPEVQACVAELSEQLAQE